MHNKSWLIITILFLAFFIRFYNLSSPFFTSEEARVASRGFIISLTGRDELGRSFPLLFNSLTDYQLPVESYLVALSELLFGKNDLGVRLPFVILGCILPFLVYKMAQKITGQFQVGIMTAFLTAISPTLVLISNIPNQIIILLNLYSLLFLIISRKKINRAVIILILFIMMLTSKIAWLVSLPFVFATIYYFRESTGLQKLQSFGKEKFILIFSMIAFVIIFIAFLRIPQGKRSILENNINIFSDITLINGINQLKGQGLDAGLNSFLERVLFNKIHLLFSGFLNWFSQLSPESFFGSIDGMPSGIYIGVLIIPFLIGIAYFIKGNRKLLVYPLIFTFPAFFMQFGKYKELILLTIPFINIIVAVGLSKLGKKIVYSILIIALVELLVTYSMTSFNKKITNNDRPTWLKQVIIDAASEQNKKIGISDNIVNGDITPYIQWFTDFKVDNFSEKIDFPYRFKRYNLGKITLLLSEQRFTSCSGFSDDIFYLSKRDLNKINEINFKLENVYKDNLNNEVVFVVSNICLN